MNNDKITREMAYLCIGDEIKKIDNSTLYYKYFKGIKYFIVEDNKLIRGNNEIYCSCNERYCWHIFKVIFDERNAFKDQ